MIFMYFGGDCGGALEFYHSVFDANVIEKTTYGEAEMTDNEIEKGLIMNSTFQIGGMTFCANDVLVDKPTPGNALSVWLEFDSEASLQEVYARFQQDDCGIETNLEETFWNSVYAKVKDPFGVIWELNCQK